MKKALIMKKYFTVLVMILVLTSSIVLNLNRDINAKETQELVRAGIRSSTYGISPFPDSTWWVNATTDMASRFESSAPAPAVIWILGYTSNNGCYLNFPNPNPGTSYSNVTFSNRDRNEAYLDAFDKNGVKVWLQIEPGDANIFTLIDLVLAQYSHHPCVIGFGVDVEWYKTSSHSEGKAVTDAEAGAWSYRIKTYNSDYLLFLKHWLINKMPPEFRTDIVFLDDSQIFSNMNSMVSEFESWGEAFKPAGVGFQFGYDSDKKWWENLDDPPGDIGNEIIDRIPNTAGLYWVDFTAYDIWPQGFVPSTVFNDENINTPNDFILYPNYPNPFNPSTTISYKIKLSCNVNLKIYNISGHEIITLIDKNQSKGYHSINWNGRDHSGQQISSGMYIYQLQAGDQTLNKKMIFIQ